MRNLNQNLLNGLTERLQFILVFQNAIVLKTISRVITKQHNKRPILHYWFVTSQVHATLLEEFYKNYN